MCEHSPKSSKNTRKAWVFRSDEQPFLLFLILHGDFLPHPLSQSSSSEMKRFPGAEMGHVSWGVTSPWRCNCRKLPTVLHAKVPRDFHLPSVLLAGTRRGHLQSPVCMVLHSATSLLTEHHYLSTESSSPRCYSACPPGRVPSKCASPFHQSLFEDIP